MKLTPTLAQLLSLICITHLSLCMENKPNTLQKFTTAYTTGNQQAIVELQQELAIYYNNAIAAQDAQSIKWLLAINANPFFPDKNGKIPVDKLLATSFTGREEILSIIEQKFPQQLKVHDCHIDSDDEGIW